MKTNEKTFWITNISDRNVMLGDLNISIKARSTVNLLDKRRYSFSEEELENSLKKGSLYRKRDKIVKRLVAPGAPTSYKIQIDSEAIVPSKTRSILEIKYENYEELQVSDEKFAEETADSVEMDRQPFIPKE